MTVRRYRLRAAPSYRIDYEAQLEEEQLQAAKAPLGPLLVIAGAGSGKTRTLIYRLARMLEEGIPPERILLLTFTNRAAREMLDRAAGIVSSLPGVDVRRIQGGTFHRVGNRVLRRFAPLLGFGSDFGIIDREDQAELVAACIADLGLGRARRFPKSMHVVDLISMSVNVQQPIEEVVAQRSPQFEDMVEDLARVMRRFRERKAAMNVMDFDDLLFYWNTLLSDHPEVRGWLQDEARAILVDEYQDTNRLQADIVERLAQKHRNLTVVGDDAQSIYSFRGAELTNILELPARYEDCRILRLVGNHRSTSRILALANASIEKNVRQFPKELSPRRGEGELPALVPARDAVQQASFIAQRILELRDEGVSLEEIAVLYRAHYQSMEIQIELARRGIPFQIRSGVRFFEQAHIKDVLAFLRVSENPKDELSFLRTVKRFPGIGPKTAQALWRAFSEGEGTSTEEKLASPSLDVAAGRGTEGWRRCREILLLLTEPQIASKPSNAIERVLEKEYAEWLTNNHLDGATRIEDIRQLAEFALQFEDTSSFLAEVSLLSEFSAEEVKEEAEREEFVTLSSIHRAKGLEWRAVFVAWLAEGRFPAPASLDDPLALEEERRCFYVAVTRAKDQLYFTYPMLAAPRDGIRNLMRPSRFIQELRGEGPKLWEKWSLEEEEIAAPPTELPTKEEVAAMAKRLLLPED